MSGLEVNKILAAIIMAVLIVFLISNIGDYLVNPNKDSNTKTAYDVEITESTTTEENKDTSEIEIESILTLLASASLEKGEKTYKKCGSCHSYTKDGKNKVGPNLWNIVNRPKANVDGFAYSSALAEFGGVWGYEELSKFLYKFFPHPPKPIKPILISFIYNFNILLILLSSTVVFCNI